MSASMEIKIEKNESWYGGLIDFSSSMPFTDRSDANIDVTYNKSLYNQTNPMLISSSGRYVYAEKYFALSVSGGVMKITSPGDIDFGEKTSFREAYEYLMKRYFPFSGQCPDKRLFTAPQYCTWMALGEKQTQADVIGFAERIVKAGLLSGLIVIDDSWTDHVGQYSFSTARFPDPKKMCDRLRELGFFVSLWVTPYVSPDSETFRELDKEGLLIRKDGEVFITHWWKGYSACIDFTNPSAREWVRAKIYFLKERYGIEFMKFDGGDPRLYEDGLQAFSPEGSTAHGLSEAYGRFAAEYPGSEIRSTSKCGGLPIVSRIADRYHCWEDLKNGFSGIVKKAIVMSVSGYPYCCPDMVGGGQYEDIENGLKEDEELNIRYMEATTFMPCIQFSKPIWEFTERTGEVVRKMLKIREKYSAYIEELAENCAKTGEPIIAPVAFCGDSFFSFEDEFLLGDKILAAPVMQKGVTEREVYLPKGVWKYAPDGKKFDGGRTVKVAAPLDTLPYFIKISEE